MEANEIMVNEELDEVVETAAEEIVKNPHNGLKIAAGTGIALIIGGLAVKFVVMPAIAKIKAKKENVDTINSAAEDVSAENEKVTDEVSEEEN